MDLMGFKRNSLLCPRCRKLVSGDETTCPYCGLAHPASRADLKIINLWTSGELNLVNIIISINAGFFLLTLLLDPGSFTLSANPFTFLSPSSEILFYFGASGAIPVFGFGRYWTVISASFLHGGLLHLLFNMLAFLQLGPFVLREYGPSRFVIIYVLAGAVGFLLSSYAGVALTIGASASICALIGAILYYGKSRNDFYGHLIYRQALGWVIGLVVIGLVVPGINNWAHGGGLVAGIVFSWVMGYERSTDYNLIELIISWLTVAAVVGVLVRSVIGVLLLLFYP
jgi:rhomboid protease GluP